MTNNILRIQGNARAILHEFRDEPFIVANLQEIREKLLDDSYKKVVYDAVDLWQSSVAIENDNMGSVCSLKNFLRDVVFIPCYKEQMIEMILTAIEHTCEPQKDYEGETRRIKNLKDQMAIMRRVTDTWTSLTDLCVNSADPPAVMLRKILDEISTADQGIGVSEVLCMCTYVTYVCMKIVSKNEKNKVCEMVEILVDYILDRGYMLCVNCLYWLDSL